MSSAGPGAGPGPAAGSGAGAGASAGAGAGAGAPPPPPQQPAPEWVQSVQQKSQELGSNVLKRAKSIKMPPVPAEFEPAMTSAQKVTTETWQKLPGPFQVAMPYVAIGATVAIGMKFIGDRALFAEKVKSMQLESKLHVVTEERDQLKEKMSSVNASMSTPKSEQEIKMSKAISEATQAAAAASQAAALAAQACIARPLPMKPSETRKPPGP